MDTKYALIIDSFLSHNSIANVCNLNKVTPIHIFSSKSSFKKNFNNVDSIIFHTSLIFSDDELFFNELNEYSDKILFVFSCTEQGQRIKDIIDSYLNLNKVNDNVFSKERYNKFYLYNLLDQPCVTTNFQNFIKQYPQCIIKPCLIENSGGCNDVSFRDSIILNGDEKPGFFISPYFEGEEYAADLVSYNGKHKLVCVWKYFRDSNETFWKHRVELLKYEENEELIINIYNKINDWLNKINYKWGPTHIELKINKNEFFCIEINFRLHGHMHYPTLKKCLHTTQHDLTLDCYLGKDDKFNKELLRYTTQGVISRIYLLNKTERFSETIKWKEIEESPGVKEIYRHVRKYGLVRVSEKSSLSCTALVILFSSNSLELRKSEELVFNLFDSTLI
jgi:hypothetical protein